MFWYLLDRSGLIEEADSDLKDDQSLKRIYESKFLPKYAEIMGTSQRRK